MSFSTGLERQIIVSYGRRACRRWHVEAKVSSIPRDHHSSFAGSRNTHPQSRHHGPVRGKQVEYKIQRMFEESESFPVTMSLQSAYTLSFYVRSPTHFIDKHFLNTPASLVLDSLEGLCAINPRLALDVQNKSEPTNQYSPFCLYKPHLVVHRVSPDRSKVALLCGGGSGHEPAHPGFVGKPKYPFDTHITSDSVTGQGMLTGKFRCTKNIRIRLIIPGKPPFAETSLLPPTLAKFYAP